MCQRIDCKLKIGDSPTLTLPKEIMDELGLPEGASVSLEFFDSSFSFLKQKLTESGVDEEYCRKVDQFIHDYRLALLKLAG